MKTKPTPKPAPRAMKPRKMWAVQGDHRDKIEVFLTEKIARCFIPHTGEPVQVFPVLVLDLRPESLAAMRDRVIEAYFDSNGSSLCDSITAQLRAIHPSLAKKSGK